MDKNNYKMDSEDKEPTPKREQTQDEKKPKTPYIVITSKMEYERHKHLASLVENIFEILSKHTDRNNIVCFCGSMVPNKTTHDIFKNYGILCYCMINHIKNIPFNLSLLIEMFILEFNLVNFLKEEIKCISQILNPDPLISSEDMENQYICAYSTFIRDIKIHINCEQAIESLSYKYYKQFIVRSASNEIQGLDYLLFLLYIRRESERYFIVYSEAQKTPFNSRITLLLTLHKNCCKSSETILRNLKKYTTKSGGLIKTINEILLCDNKVNIAYIDGLFMRNTVREADMQILIDKIEEVDAIFEKMNLEKNLFIEKNLWDDIMFNKYDEVFTNKITTFEESKIDEITKKYKISIDSALILIRITVVLINILEPDSDISDWFDLKKEKYDWSVCVKQWGQNRDQKLDVDMISCCSTFKKYDEGFLIYSELYAKNEHALTRTCSLCLNAFYSTKDLLWLERVNDILHLAFFKHKIEIWKSLIMLIFENLRLLTDDGRKRMITVIVNYFDKFHLERNEDLIKCLLKGFFTTLSQCKERDLCDICHKNAIFIYKKWKFMKKDVFRFWWQNKSLHDEIYSYVLGVCDESNDKQKFHEICSDILKNNEKIGESVLCRLEKYHEKCQCRKYSGYTHTNEKHQCIMLMRHCMSEFRE